MNAAATAGTIALPAPRSSPTLSGNPSESGNLCVPLSILIPSRIRLRSPVFFFLSTMDSHTFSHADSAFGTCLTVLISSRRRSKVSPVSCEHPQGDIGCRVFEDCPVCGPSNPRSCDAHAGVVSPHTIRTVALRTSLKSCAVNSNSDCEPLASSHNATSRIFEL